MRQSLERATAIGFVLPPLLLAWVAAVPTAATATPFLALRPGPIDRPLSIVAADFDRDGFDDLAIANFQAGTIQILINQHDGTFTPVAGGPFGVGSATFSSATAGPFDMVVTDLNSEDVDADAVVNAADNCPNVYNPVDATTSLQPDTDGNGIGDACQILVDAGCDGMIDDPIDTDQDGIPDYDPAQLPDPDPVGVALDNCPRISNPLQEDLDSDDIGDACPLSPDLLIVTSTQGGGTPFGAVRVRLNNGAGGLVNRTSISSGFNPGKVVVGDFTGDMRPDFAVAVSSVDLVQFLPGEADGMFGATTILQAGDGAQGAEAGDFNGDTRLDLAVANRTADSLSIFLNLGAGLPTTATATLTLEAQTGPVVLLSGELNGDLCDDLVVLSQGRLLCTGGPKAGEECGLDDDCADTQNPAPAGICMGGAGSIAVYTGSATGTLAPGLMLPLGAGHRPRAGLLRDLDSDVNGTLDLVVGDFTGGEVLIYSGAGDGTFAAAPTLTGTAEPASLATLDLDPAAPGGPDLAVLDHANNRIDIYVNGGGLAFSPAASTPVSGWHDTSALLLTGADGLVAVDIVLLQRATARLDVLSGIGDGAFRAASAQALAGPFATCGTTTADTTAMVEADLRQDGRPDLAVFDAAGGAVTVLTSSPFGILEEQETVPVGIGVSRVNAGALVVAIDDYDRDGVANFLDNCPAVYNPPLCPVTDPMCALTLACTDAMLAPTDCDAMDPTTFDPITQQCDSDRNGIGDHCQILGANCVAQNSDFDSRADYDPNALVFSGGGLDFDRDTIANINDNCPTLANLDQADVNPANGVGDACETLNGGLPVDPDLDGVPTFDPALAMPPDPVGDALDNCPSIYNPGQEDNDADDVGNACVIRAALDNCTYTFNSTQDDIDGDGVGNLCAVPPQDLIAANPPAGTVTLLSGDGTGRLRPASASPLSGLSGPTAGVAGQFSLECEDFPGPIPIMCSSRIPHDIAVAARGTPGISTDDSITIFKGDGFGGFTALPPAAAQGDPDDLLVASAQPMCPNPFDAAEPDLRFDPDGATDVLAAVEPGTSTLQIFLASSQDTATPGASPLVPPVAQPQPLPVQAPLRSALFTDINQDGLQDLVALSSPTGGPSAVTLYLGIGNGLYFTDPTFSPVTVAGEMTLMAATNVNLKTDVFLPEVVLFSARDQAPIVLTNTLGERADIDGSGRVDGFDLAVLAASFGATRGEDFTLQADGTLLQSGSGLGRLVIGGGSALAGQDLASMSAPCNRLFDPLTGLYGLAADVNLDGIIDGEDLALLASLFGQRLP